MSEIWKKCYDFPNYEVSNTGKMRRAKNGREIVITTDPNNYQIVRIWYNKKKYTKRIAKLVWQAFNETKCNEFIHHIDNNRANNNLDNLRCISPRENSLNRAIYRIKNKYDLTPEKKTEIINKIKKDKVSLVSIWRDYGLPTNYLSVILKRGSWDKYLNESNTIQ